MSLQRIINHNVLTVDMDATLGEIKALFHEANFHHLLVTQNGKLAGIISDRDLFKELPAAIFKDQDSANSKELAVLKKKAHQIMSRNLITLHYDSSIYELLELFTQHCISCLPVIDEEERLRGIISWRDVFLFLLEKHNQAINKEN
jgi:acetoin utilization protein AcuB